jgi:hypothetical protein
MSGKNNSPSLPRAPAGNGSYPLRHFFAIFSATIAEISEEIAFPDSNVKAVFLTV